jgi:threonine/homoserine/homoserine lactone efflux protein
MALVISMIVFSLIGAMSPGPVNIIATGSGASFGFRRTVPHILGASISYTCVVLLVGLGLDHWLTVFPEITNTLQYVGSAFLLYMAYKIATAKSAPSEHIEESKQPPSFIEGALAQSLNPKAWLVSMSGVSLFVTSQPQAMFYLFIFCVISFSLCLLGISTWAAIGHNIRGLLCTAKRQTAFNVLMGLLLSATVVSIMFSQSPGSL